MRQIAILLIVLPLAGCAVWRSGVPSERKQAYLDNAHCDTTCSLLMSHGARRACPVILQALDRYSTTNEVDVGHRIAILNAPYWYYTHRGGDIHEYSPLVARALADPSPQVRARLLHFVTCFPTAESLQILTPILNDPDPTVRMQAEDAIGTVNGTGRSQPSDGMR